MKRRVWHIMLSVMLLCTLFVSGNAQAAMVQPLYNNTATENTSFTIDDNGVARVRVSYHGYKGITTGAKIEIKLKKKGFLGLFWSDVDIGEPDNIKVYEFNDYMGSELYEFNLSSKGTYKAIVKYMVYGSGGDADTINKEIEAKY